MRRPTRGFGWLDARVLHEGWLGRLGPEATAVLAFLALAADERGASFYGRDRMSTLLGMAPRALDRALERLLSLGLVAHRPWHPGHRDGVWQLLPVPVERSTPRDGGPSSLRDILGALGVTRPTSPPP